MKICHLITRMIIGGAQENTLLSVRGLLELGHDVVLATGPTEGPEGQLLRTVEEELPGLKVVEFPDLVRELSPWQDLRAYWALKRYFRAEQFDVVHTHSSKAGILGRFAARHANCPVVVHTVHGQAFHAYEKSWRNLLFRTAERLAARRCDHIAAVAQAMITQCLEVGIAPAHKYSVVYSGMDMQPYRHLQNDQELRAALGIPRNAPVIGKIARLFELKGHDYLLSAAAAIVAEFPEVRFLLVGDGVLRPQLEAAVASAGMTKNFVFSGLVPPATVPRYIGIMDILVHLSLREGLPRTVVQALAGGVPAVAFALDGTPEVIRSGENGFLAAAGDVDTIRQALLTLLRNPQKAKAMGAAGQAQVQQQFDWQTMVTQLEAIYIRLLADKS